MVIETKQVLAEEIRTYERLKAELLASSAGRFVVIRGDRVLGTFDSFDDGYDAGLHAWGSVPMLVRHIADEQPVRPMWIFISRDRQ